jgi:hypothetical protein
MTKYGRYGNLEKDNKFSARSDEMDMCPLQRGYHFELNYAKKGALLPPKGGLPPLIGGSLFTGFLYKFQKKRSILN